MMGFGSYGNNNGGPYSSPSSSNLSASAPPFTIYRSSNTGYMPLVDLLEQSSKTGPLNSSSSLHNWLPPHSSTSDTNFLSDNLELNSMASSPTNPYTYASSNTHFPHLSTTISASADAFSYAQSGDNVAKPYYPSYLSPPAQKDGPLVIPDPSSYDWFSPPPHVSATALDGSSNNDYPQRSADSNYTAQWGGSWSGFSEWKQGNQGLFDGSFCCSKESDVPVSSMYENFMNQETHTPKGLSRGEGTMRLNRGNEGFHGINDLVSEKHSGSVNAEKFNDKSLSGKSFSFLPVDHSRSFLGSISGFPDSSPESASVMGGTSSGNHHHQIPSDVASEKQLKQLANDSISIPKCTTVVIGPHGSGFSALNNAPFKSVNLGSDKTDDTDLCSKKAPSFIDSDGVKRAFDSSQLRIHLEIDGPTFLGPYLTKNEEMLKKECATSDPLLHASKLKSGPPISNVTHDSFKLDLNTNEYINSVEDSSEGVDPCNPAVDSPCWKGVPATRSSPFDVPVPEMKRQEVSTNSNVQAKQISQLNTGDKVSSQKPNENAPSREFGSPEFGLDFPLNATLVANSTSGERKLDDIIKRDRDSGTKGTYHSEHGSMSVGCFDIKNSLNADQNIRGNGLTSENINEAMQYVSSRLPFPTEHVISSSVDDASTKLNKLNEGPSPPTIDVPVLIRTIHNLSELLLFHCTSGSFQLKQKDLETIQGALDNLSVCASRNSEKIVPALASTSEKDTLDYLGEVHKLHKAFTLDKPQVTKTADPIQDPLNINRDLLDNRNVHKGNKYHMAEEENDEMFDSVSVRADVDMVGEDKTTQALKKVLAENFNDEEETQLQAILYKNLWLEAEAALCSVSYKARFSRMKLEMEKLKSPKFKGAHENSIITEMNKDSRSEVSPDLNGVNTLSPKTKGCESTKSEESSVLSTNVKDDDVMARFQILRRGAENSDHSTVAIVDTPSSPKVSPYSNNVGKILPEALEETESSKPDIPTQVSSNLSTDKCLNDYEASVMASFHILKSREDNGSPLSTEGQLAETVDGSTIGSKSEVESSYVDPEPLLQHHGADIAQGQLTVNEFHMFIDVDSMSQSHRTNRRENSLLGGWFDRVSSEWEHVGKEELGLQNR